MREQCACSKRRRRTSLACASKRMTLSNNNYQEPKRQTITGESPSLRWRTRFLLGLAACSLTAEAERLPEFSPFGVQSGDDNVLQSSYAVGMAYNSHNGEVTIAGGTYGSYFAPGKAQSNSNDQTEPDCFVAILRLPNLSRDDNSLLNRNEIEWVRRRQFGNPSVPEFCSGIHVDPYGNIIAIGHTDEGGILEPLLPYGSVHRSVYGMVLDINENVELRGGRLLHASRVQYPVQVTADPKYQDLFVATLFSDSDPTGVEADPSTSERGDQGGHNFAVTGYRAPFYGNKLSVRLQRFIRKLGDLSGSPPPSETLEISWSREFGTSSLETVEVSSLLYGSSTLVMAGYTKGSGPAFGYRKTTRSPTLDGFLTLIDPESGLILGVKRITSGAEHDDRILNLCGQEKSNSSAVFAVGMTGGELDSTYTPGDYLWGQGGNNAFLLKIDLEDLSVVWKRQIGAIATHTPQLASAHQIHGMACTVTPDGEHVYMAGNIKDGAVLSILGESHNSAGGDDMFVAQFRSEDGTLEFARQIGSSEDDSLAQGNSLDTDSDGNLILLGNTRGSFYREKANGGVADIVVLSLGRKGGEIAEAVRVIDGTNNTLQDEYTNSRDEGGDDISSPDDSDNGPAGANATLLLDQHPKRWIATWIAGLGVFIAGLALLLRRRKSESSDIAKEFDAVDMVLEAGTISGWQARIRDGGIGDALEYHRNLHAPKQNRVPWSNEEFYGASVTMSLAARGGVETEEGASLLTPSTSSAGLGVEGIRSEDGHRVSDPLSPDAAPQDKRFV